MAKKSAPTPAPLTFDLPLSLIAKIESHRKKFGLGSTSAVVRLAIQKFDVESYESDVSEHRQISVRLPAQSKAMLAKAAKKKQVSVGELLRVAIDSLSSKAPAKPARKEKR